MNDILLVPGINNSGPGHWQTLWEQRHAAVRRVAQRDWNQPVCDEWVRAIGDAVQACAQPPILVAHSLGCLAAAHWCESSAVAVRAVLLVAVPDPAGPRFPKEARGFERLPLTLGARTAVLVSSVDDPYSSEGHAQRCAAQWQAARVRLGACGHINAQSGLGDWPQGWDLVKAWRTATPR